MTLTYIELNTKISVNWPIQKPQVIPNGDGGGEDSILHS